MNVVLASSFIDRICDPGGICIDRDELADLILCNFGNPRKSALLAIPLRYFCDTLRECDSYHTSEAVLVVTSATSSVTDYIVWDVE